MWSRLISWLVRTIFRVGGFDETPVLPSPPLALDLADAYVRSGLEFGEAVSYLHLGECDGFEELLNAWEDAERAYVEAGFRSLPIDTFISAVVETDKPLEGLFQRRDEGEEGVFHAPYYRENFLGQVVPAVDLDTYLRAETTPSRFSLPSTIHVGGTKGS
jgi:hypothetical protein